MNAPALDFFAIGFASVLIVNGVGLLMLCAILRSRDNLEVPAYGATLFLGGIFRLTQIEGAENALRLSPLVIEYIGQLCLYALTAFSFIFVEHFWGVGKYRCFRRIWQVQFVFAAIAWSAEIASGRPGAAMSIHLALVMVWTMVLVFNFATGEIRLYPEDRVVVYGLAVFIVTALHDCLVLLGMLWQIEMRAIGTLAFAATLSYSLVLRAFTDQRRLATIEADLEVARQIQHSLLPHLVPRLEKNEPAVRYIPMEAVGGDIYDFLQVGENRFGVLVADVSGHGISAALIASMVKTGVASQVRNANQPEEVIAGMNRHLEGQIEDHFVTAIYAYIDSDAGHVSIANAGHPPPLLFSRKDQAITEVSTSGIVLGLLPEETYKTSEVEVDNGDRLVFYSDGVIEAMNKEGELFSTQRLADVIKRNSSLSTEACADCVLQALIAWTDTNISSQEDDLTIVIVDMP